MKKYKKSITLKQNLGQNRQYTFFTNNFLFYVQKKTTKATLLKLPLIELWLIWYLRKNFPSHLDFEIDIM
jgi:hypothetical protein